MASPQPKSLRCARCGGNMLRDEPLLDGGPPLFSDHATKRFSVAARIHTFACLQCGRPAEYTEEQLVGLGYPVRRTGGRR